MNYIFSYKDPLTHLVDIEFIADAIREDETLIQLPAWRPGRYELGNFAKNIKSFSAFDEKGNQLIFQKITKDCWKVKTKGIKQLHIKYSYYAAELNAGSTYLDEKQLYVNPVNCCIYIPERINEQCKVEIRVPSHYKLASALKIIKDEKNLAVSPFKAWASSYHELADSPFIASPTLRHNMFIMDGVEFNLWFQGECKPNWPKIINDFFIIINEQFVTMKGPIPTDEYHFLFQILPYRFHHGVEHLSSTVIAIGPSYNIMRGDTFLEFLSISSHELFHSWNIKAIRPAEMFPYDYSKENYSRLGYVAEGVTTYYGDLLLYRSGIYSDFEANRCLSKHLQNHFDNFGRYNLSVADSSFDTWLDGYSETVPHRKTSIYSEGCLIALMTDLLIRKYSNNAHSLDDVMQCLYNDFAKKNKGYKESDYINICSKMAGCSLNEFFNEYVYKANSYENVLRECLDYVGLQLLTAPSKKYYEKHYGFKVSENQQTTKIIAIYPESVAEKAGIQLGDEIISINDYPVNNNLTEWSAYFGKQQISLVLKNGKMVRTITFNPSVAEYYQVYYVQKNPSSTQEQMKNFTCWSKRKF